MWHFAYLLEEESTREAGDWTHSGTTQPTPAAREDKCSRRVGHGSLEGNRAGD